jgi:ssDNA-binding Zn-finger/Zn-ribbon topoisomerase 1
MANFTCPTCGSSLNPLVMNKAAFKNAVNFYECSNDNCDYETEILSSLDKSN